eukprot:5235403-Alexandrium_andersonii.AAC.1
MTNSMVAAVPVMNVQEAPAETPDPNRFLSQAQPQRHRESLRGFQVCLACSGRMPSTPLARLPRQPSSHHPRRPLRPPPPRPKLPRRPPPMAGVVGVEAPSGLAEATV